MAQEGAIQRTIATLRQYLAECEQSLAVLAPSAARESLAGIAASVGRQVDGL